jgi:hypothetical protein
MSGSFYFTYLAVHDNCAVDLLAVTQEHRQFELWSFQVPDLLVDSKWHCQLCTPQKVPQHHLQSSMQFRETRSSLAGTV